MISLWNFLVEQIFGGFWLAVLGLSIMFVIILVMGSVSALDILGFLLFFILAMALGYGYANITVPIVIFLVARAIFQYMRWLERGGQG